MENTKKETRGFEQVSHFFLSGQSPSGQVRELVGNEVKGTTPKIPRPRSGISRNKGLKRRGAGDFFAIFNDLISKSDVLDNDVPLRAVGYEEGAQGIEERLTPNLTLDDFLGDVDEEVEFETEQATEATELSVGGKKTILFVDTDEDLLELGKEMLSTFGYRVLTAINGESALELYKNEIRQIDLVILELIMPGIGGRRCLEELVKLRPDAKVVVSTGVADCEIMSQAIKTGAKSSIRKPYHFGQMLEVIRKVLDQD